MLMDGVLADVRYGWRQWRRAPVAASVALLSLVLGIGLTTALLALVDAVYLTPLPIPDCDSLVSLRVQRIRHLGRAGEAFVSTLAWEHIRDTQRILASVAAASPAQLNMASGGESRFVDALYVNGDFFETLGVHTCLGRPLRPLDDLPNARAVVVVDHDFWRSQLGGRADIVGTTIVVAGDAVDVVGVTVPSFYGIEVGRRTQLYLPIAARILIAEREDPDVLRRPWLLLLGRLRVGQSVADANRALAGWQPVLRANTRELAFREDEHLEDPLEFAAASHGLSQLRRDVGRPLLYLLVGGALVFFMACSNVASMLSARFSDRRGELWVRRALGASRTRVTRALLIEILLLTSVGAALGVALAVWVAGILVPSLLPNNAMGLGTGLQPYLAIQLNWHLVAIGVLLAFVSALLAGFPAAAGRPTFAERAGVETRRAPWSRAGWVLLTGQVAASLLLVSAASVVVRSFLHLTLQPTALDLDRVLLAKLDGPVFEESQGVTLGRLDRLIEGFESAGGVEAASLSTITPLSGFIVLSPVDVPGFTMTDPRDAATAVNRVTPKFFQVFGTRIVKGRAFDGRDGRGAPPVAIVNTAFVRRYFREREPIGRRVRLGARLAGVEIVGVAEDAKYMSLRESERPIVYVPLAQRLTLSPQPLRFAVRGQQGFAPATLRKPILGVLRRLEPRLTLQFTTLYDEAATSVQRERILAWSGGLVAVLALSMAAIGLYGAFSHLVVRRTQEIAVRVALGATPGSIGGLVFRGASLVVAAGCSVGLAGAALCAQVVDALVFDVRVLDAPTLGVTLGLIGVTAAAATVVPVVRACRVDPAVVLRSE